MYLCEDKIERNALRQGDIICKTHIIGALDLNSIQYSSNNSGESMFWTVPEKPLYAPAVVLSHSCEIDSTNGDKVTSVILAPLRDVTKIAKPEIVKQIIEDNLINDNTTHSYLKFFYFKPNVLLPQFPEGCVADFFRCYSLKKNSFVHLLDNKILQLEEEYSNHLALKYSLYFFRDKSSA